jgi:hypothetical protein
MLVSNLDKKSRPDCAMLTADEMVVSDGVEDDPCRIKYFSPDGFSGCRLCWATGF